MPVPRLTSARDLLSRFRVLFCDVWGVVHDGRLAYPGAMEALSAFRAGGGTVILLSNAPIPHGTVEKVLAEKRVDPASWDAIVSSGDLTRDHLAARGYRAIHHIGPARDLPLFAGVDVARVDLDSAQALVVTGLVDDTTETAADYQPLLERALARRLPLVCANPDLVVEVGARTVLCAGSLAAPYEAMGGEVYWAGKPYPAAYAAAFKMAERLRGSDVAPAEVLAIGDAVRTDLAGAAAAGISALFITDGIHKHELAAGRTVADVLGDQAPTTISVMEKLAW